MKRFFFQRKCFFDLNNCENKLMICGQELDYFPLKDGGTTIDSIFHKILNFFNKKKYKIGNLAIHLSLQRPKLSQDDINYKILIRDRLCNLWNLPQNSLTVQAGTGEKIGDVGNAKAMIFIANALLVKKSNESQELIGFGYDRHRFFTQSETDVKTPSILCGQQINYYKNINAHSDGDIVFHAMTNAIFSAIGAGDIGEHFPDIDQKWKNAKSIQFVEYALNLLKEKKLQTKSIKIEIVTSLRFQNVLKKMNFVEKAQKDLMKLLNIKSKKKCYVKLNLANEKNQNRDERCIKNDLGIESNVWMHFIPKAISG